VFRVSYGQPTTDWDGIPQDDGFEVTAEERAEHGAVVFFILLAPAMLAVWMRLRFESRFLAAWRGTPRSVVRAVRHRLYYSLLSRAASQRLVTDPEFAHRVRQADDSQHARLLEETVEAERQAAAASRRARTDRSLLHATLKEVGSSLSRCVEDYTPR